MYYLPFIPRLKRLYAYMSSAPYMRWRHENRQEPGILCHPSDDEAWKHFDKIHCDIILIKYMVKLENIVIKYIVKL